MPLNIPLPDQNKWGDFSDILQNIMQNHLKGQELAETSRYHTGSLEQQAKELEERAKSNQLLNQYRMSQLALEKQNAPLKTDLLKAQIDSLKALAKNRKEGAGKFGSGTGDELKYHATIAEYNPGLTPEQLREASDVYAQGGDTLSDGTKLAPMLPNSTLQRTLDRAVKSTTTANLINQSVQAQQAQEEMPIFDKYINEGVEPYGTTTFGISPQQIKDSLDVDNHIAQKRLGKYLAAQQLLYDRAALTLRVNALPPGKRIADEIKNLSFQSVNAKFPRMSEEARKSASEIVAKALQEALKARQSVKIGASQAFGKNERKEEKIEKRHKWKVENGILVKD
jgi:hypothetical protein